MSDDNNPLALPTDGDDQSDGKWPGWPSAENYTVPADFKPTLDKPLPAQRCSHIKDDGEQCKRFAIRGTGINSGRPVCTVHGGQLPVVREAAQRQLEAARMRLLADADLAIDTLFELIQQGTADNVRLSAANSILDRSGITKTPETLNVVVEQRQSAADIVAEKLKQIASRVAADSKPEPEDLGEIVGEESDDDATA